MGQPHQTGNGRQVSFRRSHFLVILAVSQRAVLYSAVLRCAAVLGCGCLLVVNTAVTLVMVQRPEALHHKPAGRSHLLANVGLYLHKHSALD